MEPVRVKYYGLFWLRRPTYLILQAIALILCLVMVIVGLLGVLSSGSVVPHLPAKGHDDELIEQGLVVLFWVGLLTLAAEGTETYVMLRKFARAEAEQQARAAPLDPGQAAPTSTAVQCAPDQPSSTNIQP
jgi:hypothetical protein